VHDKQVRRRRAVLGLLVGCSLILLTAYFGEAPSSPLHSVQRGIVDVLSPVQSGASKVLSPVRDLAGWVSDTVHAKSQNSQLKAQNANLHSELSKYETAYQQNQQLRGLIHLDQNIANVNNYKPVPADVIDYDPNVFYETITIDHGTDSGINLGDPVLGGSGADKGGLVGEVSSVGSDWAVISELSSNKFAAGATVIDGSNTPSEGVLQPAVGNPTLLQLNYLPQQAQVNVGDQVLTDGFKDPNDTVVESCYPPGIPIGTVESSSYNASTNAPQVEVSPEVNLREIGVVQVLTKPVVSGGGKGGPHCG
jgi:rod shape-determining protein MreC